VVGLDIEWVGKAGENVDVIQVACLNEGGTSNVLVVQVQWKHTKPDSLVELLTLDGMQVVGNGVRGDVSHLATYFHNNKSLKVFIHCVLPCLAPLIVLLRPSFFR
jgi:hypothetical protein